MKNKFSIIKNKFLKSIKPFSIIINWRGIIMGVLTWWLTYQFLSKLNEEFTNKDFIITLLLSFIVFLLSTFVFKLTDYIYEEGLIKQEIDAKHIDAIHKFTNMHEGFIQGIYENYPHNFTKLFDKDEKDSLKNFFSNKTEIRSLFIWFHNVNIENYSKLANNLLQLTSHSIYSTTYFDNNDLVYKAFKPNSNVRVWINSVNTKKIEDNIEVIRVHIFKNNSNHQPNTTKDMGHFIKLLKRNSGIKDFYCNEYIKKATKFFAISLFENNHDHFFGEYIIFDKKIMIRYDEDFKTLEIIIGKLVKALAEKFNNKKGQFTSTNNLLNRLNCR